MTWTLGGSPIVQGHLQHPAAGTWDARVQITGAAPTGAITLSMSGLDLSGTVIDAGTVSGRTWVRVVGGAGQLAAQIDGQAFNEALGRQVADVILQACGEVLDPASDAPELDSVLPAYSYCAGAAAAALNELCLALGCTWWMTPAGQVFLGVQEFPAATPAGLLVQDVRAELRRLDVAMEDAPVLPRTSITDLGGVARQVLAVDHELQPGSWRAHVRYGAGGGHPAGDQLRDLVQHLQIRTVPPLRARVLSQANDGTLELELQLSEPLQRLWGMQQGLKRVPLAAGLWGAKIPVGSMVKLELLGGDPGDRWVTQLLSGTPTELSVGASTKVTLGAPAVDVGNSGAAVKLAGGNQKVLRAGDPSTGLTANTMTGVVTGTHGPGAGTVTA